MRGRDDLRCGFLSRRVPAVRGANGYRVMQIVGGLAAALVLLVFLMWMFQRRLIYLPLEQQLPAVAAVLPGAEEVRFETEDGLTLDAWFVAAVVAPPRATVVVFHGNAGHRADRAPLAAALARDGFSVLLVDYRGYGGNPGKPDERGLLADARAAQRYVASRQDVDPARLIYFGESLGAAVALALAVERQPAALVLRSPFTSLADAGSYHYPFLPVRLLLSDRYPSVRRAARLTCPLLVVAAEQDRVVPVAQSRRLFESAAPAVKRFLLIEGADHNDYELLAGARMLEEIGMFWDEAGPPAAGEDS